MEWASDVPAVRCVCLPEGVVNLFACIYTLAQAVAFLYYGGLAHLLWVQSGVL